MNNLDFTNIIGGSLMAQLNLVLKLFFLVADGFLIIFLIVVIKQVLSMDHIVHDSNDFLFIKTFAFLLLFVAVSLFLISLAIL